MQTDNTIQNLLPELGFSNTECRIISVLLRGNTLSAARIARLSDTKRPTAYATLNTLIDRGLVVRASSGSTTTFSLVPIDMFAELITNREQQRFARVQYAAEGLKKTLAARKESESLLVSDFHIEVLESYDAVYHQLLEVLTSGDFDSVFDPHLVLPDGGKKVVADFLKRTSGDGPKIREVVISGPGTDWYRANIKNRNHVVKEISRSNAILSDVIIASDSVIVSHYNPPDELAIKISHAGFCRTLQTMFDLLWNSLVDN